MRTKLHREEGAAAVEFALIVGVLAMLLFGMLQFGVAFFQLQNLRAATREGARVGATRGTVDEIRASVYANSGINTFGNSLIIERQTSANTYATVSTGTDRPCVTTTDPQPLSVRTRIDLASPQLPNGLKNIFSVDIPLMPTISLTNASVSGEFRCEN
jgi:Flp pilus assembly protein TadG